MVKWGTNAFLNYFPRKQNQADLVINKSANNSKVLSQFFPSLTQF